MKASVKSGLVKLIDSTGPYILALTTFMFVTLSDLIDHTHYAAGLAAGLTMHWWAFGLGLALLPVLIPLFVALRVLLMAIADEIFSEHNADEVFSSKPADGQLETAPPDSVAIAFEVLDDVLVGHLEEITMRGVAQAVMGFWVATTLFAVLHLYRGSHWRKSISTSYVAYTWVLGAVLGLLYMWTGNLWVSIILHCGTNMITSVPYTHRLANRWSSWVLLPCKRLAGSLSFNA